MVFSIYWCVCVCVYRRFLLGLQAHGKGDWRNISRNFVMSKTPTQVASHAQKYFLRQLSGGKDKKRPSIHDITTVHLPTTTSPSSDDNKTSTSTSTSTDKKQPSEFSSLLLQKSTTAQKLLFDWNNSNDDGLFMVFDSTHHANHGNESSTTTTTTMAMGMGMGMGMGSLFDIASSHPHYAPKHHLYC